MGWTLSGPHKLRLNNDTREIRSRCAGIEEFNAVHASLQWNLSRNRARCVRLPGACAGKAYLYVGATIDAQVGGARLTITIDIIDGHRKISRPCGRDIVHRQYSSRTNLIGFDLSPTKIARHKLSPSTQGIVCITYTIKSRHLGRYRRRRWHLRNWHHVRRWRWSRYNGLR